MNAGINVANMREHIVDNIASNNNQSVSAFYQNSIKPTFGIFYEYRFNEKMGLRLNVQYMGLGYKNNDPNLSLVENLTINYISLPLTFHYSVNKHLSFSSGPYLSFTLGGTKINNQSITKTYHHNDDGFIIGGEHDLYKGLAISANYIFGLKNIWLNDTSNDPSGSTTHTKVTNRALQISLIYKFKKSS